MADHATARRLHWGRLAIQGQDLGFRVNCTEVPFSQRLVGLLESPGQTPNLVSSLIMTPPNPEP